MITRISTSQMYQNGLNGILKNQNIINNTIKEISSGKKEQTTTEKVHSMLLENDIKNNEQLIKNNENIEYKLKNQENILKNIQDTLVNIKDIALEAINNTNSNNKDIYLNSFNELKNNLLSLLNSKDIHGNYIFSGYNSKINPFDNLDTNSYLGDSGKISIRINDTMLIGININGNEIIDSKTTNFINKLNNFLTTNNNFDYSFFDDFNDSFENINVLITNNGNKLNSIDKNITYINNENILNNERLSILSDADMVESINKLNQAKNALEASLKTQVIMQNLSIFNYI